MKKFYLRNFVTNTVEIVTEEELVTRLPVVKAQYLELESYRFSIVKVTTEGNNTTWSAADLSLEDEIGEYQTFNQFIGTHEKFDSLRTAKARRVEMMEEFANDAYSNLEQVDETPPTNIETIP